MINIDVVLPDLSRAINAISNSPDVNHLLMHNHAFSDDEYELFGSAIKTCAIKNISVTVIGDIEDGEEENLDSQNYAVSEVFQLGKKIKELAKITKCVNIPATEKTTCTLCNAEL